MNKLLIISYNFVPNSPTFGSVARCTYLYKHLKNLKFSVDVLSVAGNDYGFFGHHGLDSNDLHYVKSNLKRKRQQKLNSKGLKKKSVVKGIVTNLLRFLNSYLIIPDYSIHSIWSVYCKSIELIDKKSLTTVIVSAPPHGLSLVLLLLKMRRPNLNYILEYRDSWNTQPIFKKGNYFSNKISKLLELWILNSINTLVYVSPVVPELIKDELGFDVYRKSALIMNGFIQPAERNYRKPRHYNQNIKMAYFGVINDFENSFRSICFIDRFIKKSKLKIGLDLYGHIEFEKFDLEISDAINYRGSIDHEEVFNKTQDYDFLVLLHTDQDSSFEPIPGKFFDYMQARRPIICIMSPNAYISKFITEHRIGLVIDPEFVDTVDFEKELSSFKFNDRLDITAYSREVQFNKYLPLLTKDA